MQGKKISVLVVVVVVTVLVFSVLWRQEDFLCATKEKSLLLSEME